MKELDFEKEKSKLFDRIKMKSEMVLATSYKDQVSARMVYCACDGVNIYFMTSKAYKKFKQMEKNSKVALCFDNIQIEGIAKFMGHPSADANADLLHKCSNATKEFLAYGKYKNTELIQVEITMIETWKNRGREFTDFTSGVSYRIG